MITRRSLLSALSTILAVPASLFGYTKRQGETTIREGLSLGMVSENAHWSGGPAGTFDPNEDLGRGMWMALRTDGREEATIVRCRLPNELTKLYDSSDEETKYFIASQAALCFQRSFLDIHVLFQESVRKIKYENYRNLPEFKKAQAIWRP